MHPLGSKAMFYLAAAVSDFFIPRDRMAEHKIQSSEVAKQSPSSGKQEQEQEPKDESEEEDGREQKDQQQSKKLVINLYPVPKFLHRLVDGWAPDGSMIVSFKLETDPNLLVHKAQTALQRYAHHLVIGNLLSTRKWEVVFVTPEAPYERWIRVPKSRRGKSISGEEAQVGLAQVKKAQEQARNGGDGSVPGERVTAREGHGGEEDGAEGMEIERLIIPELVKLHSGKMERT